MVSVGVYFTFSLSILVQRNVQSNGKILVKKIVSLTIGNIGISFLDMERDESKRISEEITRIDDEVYS